MLYDVNYRQHNQVTISMHFMFITRLISLYILCSVLLEYNRTCVTLFCLYLPTNTAENGKPASDERATERNEQKNGL